MQLRRNRSTRSLWDPNYIDQRWINNAGEAHSAYAELGEHLLLPGTQIGITEYNWGAEGHINGATTQADILGIFGREGLDLATRWTTPDLHAHFQSDEDVSQLRRSEIGFRGHQRIRHGSEPRQRVGIRGATLERRRVDGPGGEQVSHRLNARLPEPQPIRCGTGSARWQLTASNAIQHLADVPVSNGAISAQLPQQSITLFVIPVSNPASCDINANGAVNVVDVQLTINQVLGIISCTTADLQHNGQCNVIDVQRVVNAALGGPS